MNKSKAGPNLKRVERKLLIRWMRFAQAHRNSHRLPFGLFLILLADGFVMVIPSTLCLMAAVTISPARWFLFGSLATLAAFSNNLITYFLGRILPSGTLESLVQWAHLGQLWNSAHEAIHNYGPFAAFIGSLTGLPTQMITALIGISDGEVMRSQIGISSSLVKVASFVLIGHGLKSITIAALTRYGWVRLERKLPKTQI